MVNLKAVLFDLDGTLIDSEYFYFSNWQPILKREFGVDLSFEGWLEHFAGHTLVRNVAYMRDLWDIQTTEEYMWKATREAYANSNMKEIKLMPYATELLHFLKDKEVGIGLVTSSYRTTADTVLGTHGLLNLFDFFVTRDSVTNPKPNPEPYLLGAKLANVPYESIVAIEDTTTGTTSAKDAGLFCIAASKHVVERERLKHADLLVSDMNEIKQHFQQWLVSSNS